MRDDIAAELTCEVTAQGLTPAESAPVEVTSPRALTPPSVTGDPTLGTALTCLPGTWDAGDYALTYRWLRDADLVAATATYTVTTDDFDTDLRCEVVAEGVTVEGVRRCGRTAPSAHPARDQRHADPPRHAALLARHLGRRLRARVPVVPRHQPSPPRPANLRDRAQRPRDGHDCAVTAAGLTGARPRASASSPRTRSTACGSTARRIPAARSAATRAAGTTAPTPATSSPTSGSGTTRTSRRSRAATSRPTPPGPKGQSSARSCAASRPG